MSQWRLDDSPRLRVEGRWWRMLSPRWHRDPLSGAGAARSGGRWNARGVPALYLSATHTTAIAEYMQSLIHPGTLTPYDVRSAAILDLTDSTVQDMAGVNAALLELPWRRIRDIDQQIPESWVLAREAAGAGFDGMRVRSVQEGGLNLVLWRWSGEGVHVEVVDPNGDLR